MPELKHFSTDKMYKGYTATESKRVVEGVFPSQLKGGEEWEDGHPLKDAVRLNQEVLGVNLVSALNAADQHLERLQGISGLSGLSTVDGWRSYLYETDLLKQHVPILIERVTGIIDAYEAIENRGTFSTEQQADYDELVEILGWLTTIQAELENQYLPNRFDEEVITFLTSIPLEDANKKSETGPRLPKPSELREFIFDLIQKWIEDLSRDKVTYGDIVLFHSGESGNVNLIRFFEMLDNNAHLPFLKEYMSIVGDVFGYGKLLAARALTVATLENYANPEGLIQAFREMSRYDKDGHIVSIYEGIHKLKDEGVSPPTERMRAATIIYDQIGIINLIQERASIYPDYYSKLLRSKAAWQNEFLVRGYSLNNIDQVNLFTQAQLLREQPLLKWLTQAEAEFLIKNIKRLMPLEQRSQEDIKQTREVIALLSSVGPIREDGSRSSKEKGMNLILNPGLKVKVGESGEKIYEINVSLMSEYGVSIKHPDYEALDNSTFEIRGDELYYIDSHGNVEQVRKTAYFEAYDLQFNLVDVIKHMSKFGGRIESVAHELFLPTYQAAQADTGYTWGYHKSVVPLSQLEPYAMRYAFNNYVGPHVGMAKIIRRLIGTWQDQARVQHPTTGETVTLAELMSDNSVDFTEIGNLYRKGMKTEEIGRLADNLSRAYDLWKVISANEGIFGYAGISFTNLPSIKEGSDQALKFADKLREIRKKILYFIDMFDIYDVFNMVNPWQFLGVDKQNTRVALLLKEARQPRVSEEEKKSKLAEARELLSRDILLAIMEESIADAIRNSFYRQAINYTGGDDSPEEIYNIYTTAEGDIGRPITKSLSALRFILMSTFGRRMVKTKDERFIPFVVGAEQFEADQIKESDYKHVLPKGGEFGIIVSMFSEAVWNAAYAPIEQEQSKPAVTHDTAFRLFVKV